MAMKREDLLIDSKMMVSIIPMNTRKQYIMCKSHMNTIDIYIYMCIYIYVYICIHKGVSISLCVCVHISPSAVARAVASTHRRCRKATWGTAAAASAASRPVELRWI